MTKLRLLELLTMPQQDVAGLVTVAHLNDSDDYRSCRVQGVSRENGSGHCFNVTVTITDTGLRKVIFVRLCDERTPAEIEYRRNVKEWMNAQPR